MHFLFEQNDANEQNFRFLVLFFTLVALLLVPTYFEDMGMLHHAWMLCSSSVMVAALYSLAGGGLGTLIWLVLLLIPSFVTNCLSAFMEGIWVVFADNLTSILYFALVGYYLARFIMRARVVTSNVIYAALCLYMIIALIWAAIYNLHFLFVEDSFGFSNEALIGLAKNAETTVSLFNYYSFVTLTTLGYGDIVPLNRMTQGWVAVEAMVGQFYIAIIIARLVSSLSYERD